MSEQTLHEPASPEPSVGKLITEVVRDLQQLYEYLIKIAKRELTFSAKAAAFGVGAFLGAALFLVMVVILGSITLAYLISLTGLHLAWSYMIVTALYLLGAVILVFFGINRFKKVKKPEKTIDAAKEIGQSLKSPGGSHVAPRE